MLLRSASTPLLNSPWTSHDSSESALPPLPRTRCITLSMSPLDDTRHPRGRIPRASSEPDLGCISLQKKRAGPRVLFEEEEEEDEEVATGGYEVGMMLGGGTGGGDGGGGGGGGMKVCGGGGGGGKGSDERDLYYKRLIEGDPTNHLLLSNYSRFLKEVRGDFVKAEEYCARAILANPNDGNALSMYGDLIWQSHKDAERAEDYFNQAVKASPDDCYVMASYARFLWDAEEEDEDQDVENTAPTSLPSSPLPTTFFHGVSRTPPPLAAAS